MAGRRPDKRVVLKSKDKNGDGKHTYVDLLATWVNENGTQRLTIDRNIVSIELADGRRIAPQEYFVNLQEQRDTSPRQYAKAPEFSPFED